MPAVAQGLPPGPAIEAPARSRRQLAGATGRAWSAWLRISGETGARRRRLARYRSWLRARFCRATFERWVSRNEGDALRRTSSARMRRTRLSRGLATLRGSADAKLTTLALSRTAVQQWRRQS